MAPLHIAVPVFADFAVASITQTPSGGSTLAPRIQQDLTRLPPRESIL